jgi:hypothetical protein
MTKISLPEKIKKEMTMVELKLPPGGRQQLETMAVEQGFIYRGKPALGQFVSEVLVENLIVEEQPTTEE